MQITNECHYLIHLIRCAIHDLQPQELPEGLEFEAVFKWGEHHHVANIAFYSLEKLAKKPEPDLYRKWQTCRDQAVVRDINQGYAAMEIREALRGANIRMLEVQGTKIKPLYPQPDWRTMSDIDFIIDLENLDKAKEILIRLGYACADVDGEEIEAHRPPNINVEMHTEYFPAYTRYRNIMSSPFASVDETGQCDLNTLYLYNIIHIAKHYFGCGCGIRRVLDVYYLNQAYGPILHRTRIQEQLKRANIESFTAGLERLANAWFGREEQAFPENKMAHYIIDSGLHGVRPNLEKNNLEQKLDKTVRFPKLRYFLRRFFGTAGNLQTRYPVLRTYKILYPFFWIWRVLSILHPGALKRIRREVNTLMDIDLTE